MSLSQRKRFCENWGINMNLSQNISLDVVALNCGQLGRTIKALVFNGDLSRQVRMCSMHCTAKDEGGLQYTNCPVRHETKMNLSQNKRVKNHAG